MYEVSGYPVGIRPIKIPENFRDPDFDVDAWIEQLKRESDEWKAQLEEQINNQTLNTQSYEGD